MKSFLQQVAQHYANESHLEDLCFIFPNQRGCSFFEQALQNELRHTTLLPQTMPMANFLGRLIGRVPASDLEALLVLYKAYCQVMGKTATPIAKFMQWGSIILNDFNDADLNLVDIYSLFTNVGDLRQISTDYLSPELKQLIGQMLHLNVGSWDDDDDNLWRRQNAGENDGEVKRTYFELWNNLHVIYDQFHRLLQEKGLSTTGHIYRETVRNISGAELENMGISRVVFVGFGYLHASELAIFKTLKDCGHADFWWDDASPIFSNEDQNPAAHYVSRYARLFPSPVVIEPLSFASQTISVVGIPSTVGQAKWAFHHVDQMIESGEIPHPENAIDTAIVLPDDSLFIPVLNSISPQLGQINVTMGYPLRRSSIVSLMHLVAKAHHRATPDTNNHESDFFRDDVKDILSHPIIKMAFTRQAMLALNRLEATNEWRVPASTLTSFDFGDLFKPIPDADTANAIFEYINRLTVFCEKLLARIDGEASSHQRENSDNSVLPERTPLQSAFIKQYIDVLSQIKRTFAEHDIAAAGETVFFLVDRLTRTVVIPFEGEPLAGLQIMGLLETRSLDFQNMIVLSMNEHIFPKKHSISSFIPDHLRRAHHMPTAETEENVTAYNFYRMICRAKQVTLVHCTSSQKSGPSEPSRFITQLEKLYGINADAPHTDAQSQVLRNGRRVAMRHITVEAKITVPNELVIQVPKAHTPLPDYVSPGVDEDEMHAHCLSASSINEYINCPLLFYLRHVEKLREFDKRSDFMDAATYGSIIHDTLQELYYPTLEDGKERQGEHIVTIAMMEDFKAHRLRRIVERIINRTFINNPEGSPITGTALMLQESIETYATRAIDFDLQLLQQQGFDHLTVLECERKHQLPLRMGKTQFNFTFKADRVDLLGDTLRIIDYKTGRERTQVKTVKDLFEDSSDVKRAKGILQLVLYCNAWCQIKGERTIQPLIYRLGEVDQTGVFVKNQQLFFERDNEFNREFSERIESVVSELLNQETPFIQTSKPDTHCKWCAFAGFCNR